MTVARDTEGDSIRRLGFKSLHLDGGIGVERRVKKANEDGRRVATLSAETGQEAGMISRALISGFSILLVKVMSSLPSVTSTSTVST